MGKWIEILKTGTFTAKNGKEVTITGADLDAIQKNNPSSERQAPLVFGHPEDNAPAFGWLDKVKRNGDILLAAFREVPEVVNRLVKDGYYRKVSVSLMPDKKTLRHVGLLGAVQPAVPGLKDVSLSQSGEAEQLVFEFSTGESQDDPGNTDNENNEEGDMPTVEELKKKLAEEKAAREAAEENQKTAETEAEKAKTELSESKKAKEKTAIETRVNALVGKTILAKDKPIIERVALALGGAEDFELSEGSGKKSLQDHLFDFLSGLPSLGLETEFSAPKGEDGKELDTSDLTGCV